ncbi:hypothetical protein [Acidipropionibacterium timonense]|uniref:hypothetical protein n=1 Tax=Acidipropionibacterium timonense TaxID=2161818 RepID=UPI00102F8BD4|nr:hypothetical protein [Acidipropionibacterium timonense]
MTNPLEETDQRVAELIRGIHRFLLDAARYGRPVNRATPRVSAQHRPVGPTSRPGEDPTQPARSQPTVSEEQSPTTPATETVSPADDDGYRYAQARAAATAAGDRTAMDLEALYGVDGIDLARLHDEVLAESDDWRDQAISEQAWADRYETAADALEADQEDTIVLTGQDAGLLRDGDTVGVEGQDSIDLARHDDGTLVDTTTGEVADTNPVELETRAEAAAASEAADMAWDSAERRAAWAAQLAGTVDAETAEAAVIGDLGRVEPPSAGVALDGKAPVRRRPVRPRPRARTQTARISQ